jgi:hypothetical protein
LRAFRISRLGSFSGDPSDSRSRNDNNLVATWEEMEREANALQNVRSPDGNYIHPSNFPYKPKRVRRHPKDSVMSPEQMHFRDSNAGLEPEHIVPSALDDQPMRPMNNAQPVQKKSHHFTDDMDDQDPKTRSMVAENDYADAVRDMQRDSASTSNRTSNSIHPTAPR